MATDDTEPEILDGQRGYADAQAAFNLTAGTPGAPALANICWYDTAVDERTGYFALVQNGGAFEDRVGDIIEVSYGVKRLRVYVLGTADIPCELGLARAAFLKLADLASVEVQVMVRTLG